MRDICQDIPLQLFTFPQLVGSKVQRIRQLIQLPEGSAFKAPGKITGSQVLGSSNGWRSPWRAAPQQ